MNLLKFSSLLLLISFFSLNTYSQNLASAHKKFENFSYADAIIDYEDYLKKHEDQLAEERLAECYRMINKLDKAEKWYAKVMKYEDKEPTYILYYAQVLQVNGKCPEAVDFAKQYNALVPGDSRGKSIIEACENSNVFEKDAILFEVKQAPLNSPNDDFGAILYNNGIVFTSDRPNNKKTTDWTNKPYLDVYYAAKKGEDYFSLPVKLNGDFKSQYHIGPVCFNEQATIAYITRNVNSTSKNNIVSRVKLYKAIMKDGKWDDLKILPFCQEEYNYAYPYLSPDGKYLYFASDMEGGQGGVDIYRVSIDEEEIGDPENLGPTVNTKGDERFPTISSNGDLYFSSNGHPGLGAQDLFISKKNGTSFGKAQNMGAPINSQRDDFGLIWNTDNNSGYFSSNRPGGAGGDDIYHFVKTAIICEGSVFDSKTSQRLDSAQVIVFKNGEIVERLVTDDKGQFRISLVPDASYKIQASQLGYTTNFKSINTSENEKNYRADIPLLQEEKVVVAEDVIFKVEGIIRNKETGKPLSNANIKINNQCNNSDTYVTTGDDGYYTALLERNCDYNIYGIKENFFASSTQITTKGWNNSQTFKKDIELAPIELNKAIKLENIYYDVNKWDIRPDAAFELDKLVKILKENPGIKIELGSHTDCRASDEYNLNLSSKRATSAVSYIISKGIDPSRLSAVGYGETQPVNQCTNGVQCTEIEHQMNRRTEFKVTSYDASSTTVIASSTPTKTTTNTNPSSTSSTTTTSTSSNLNAEVFKIQIKIVNTYNEIDFASVKDLGKLNTESTGSGFSRVLIGDFATLNDAKVVLKYAKERGFEDAYIVAYKNGVRGRIY